MSYLEPGYHRANEPPFSFPPAGTKSSIESNLIEIQGKNGTGKTTLLNVLALALGYLNEEKELETKPMLKTKLEDLNENPSLEYLFRITYSNPEPVEIVIERKRGQEPQRWLNSKPISSEKLSDKFDIIFLTEDDPSKVVSASRDKLAGYFSNLDKRLFELQGNLNKHLLDIVEFRDYEGKEKNLLKEIDSHNRKSLEVKIERQKIAELLTKAEHKREISQQIDLLNHEAEITRKYQTLKEKYNRLEGKEDEDLRRKIEKERKELGLIEREIKDFNLNILQLCTSLKTYGVSLDTNKLLKDDYSEFYELLEKIRPESKDETISLHIVDDMLSILQSYDDNIIVPVIEKKVGETKKELYRAKVKLSSDRVSNLAKVLNRTLDQKSLALSAQEKLQSKINGLKEKRKDLEGFEEVENEFNEAQNKYMALQASLQNDKLDLLERWESLKTFNGNPEDLTKKLQQLDIELKTEETLKTKYEENLATLEENSSKKPIYEKNEDGLKCLMEKTSRMRENIHQWSEILSRPAETRKEFESTKQRSGFGLKDYQVFTNAVGEYLGQQFEPVLYDYKLQNIKFFDIEKNTFLTDDDRHIPIDKLSQGQSKMATITGIFKKMDDEKKKIVLIDEIADLDPENLANVKSTLKERYKDGSLALSVLVRPCQEAGKKIDVFGWG